jgi:hypothetical protein
VLDVPHRSDNKMPLYWQHHQQCEEGITMGLLVSATEAGYLCGCSDRSIRRKLEDGSLKAQKPSMPRRTRPADEEHPAAVGPSHWRIDVDDLPAAGLIIIEERLRALEERRSSPERVLALLTENAQLRTTIERLRELMRNQAHHEEREDAPASLPRSGGMYGRSGGVPRPKKTPATKAPPGPQLPDGYVTPQDMAERHSVPRSNVEFATTNAAELLPTQLGKWFKGNAHVYRAFDEECQKAFVVRFWGKEFPGSPARQRFMECDIAQWPDCYCHVYGRVLAGAASSFTSD